MTAPPRNPATLLAQYAALGDRVIDRYRAHDVHGMGVVAPSMPTLYRPSMYGGKQCVCARRTERSGRSEGDLSRLLINSFPKPVQRGAHDHANDQATSAPRWTSAAHNNCRGGREAPRNTYREPHRVHLTVEPRDGLITSIHPATGTRRK